MAVAVLAGTLVVAGCSRSDPSPVDSSPVAEGPGPPTTPPLPAPGDGRSGELLAATERNGADVPTGARAWHVAYRHRDSQDRPVVATALVVVPIEAAPGGGPHPVVGWAHPTTGTADGCAPSLDGPAAIPHLSALLADGWAVVAPDYEGLGPPGPHPYLVGASEGSSLLEALVAARQVDGAGIEATSPTALWGFSQGGHAAAFAAEMAPTAAPDVALIGLAVAAPVSDVTHFAQRAERRPDQLGVLVTIVGGFAAAYPDVDPAAVLTDDAVGRLDLLESACIGEVVEQFPGPVAQVSRRPVADDPALAARLAENLAGLRPVTVPVLVVQGTDDDIVDPADTAALVDRWCAQGVAVTEVVRPGGDHGTPADDLLLPWLATVRAGATPPDTCGVGAEEVAPAP